MSGKKTRLIDTQDAFNVLTDYYHHNSATQHLALQEALNKVPTADTEPNWIPCRERLPEDDTEVIVSCTDDSGDSEFSYTTTGWHFKGMWVVGNERSYFVRAWMPLPRHYEAEE